jgi:asparaginyl-tRNA synthetase
MIKLDYPKATLSHTIDKVKRKDLKDILTVQQGIIRAVHEYMWRKDVLQIMPLMLSPITDPLNHSVVDASIEYADQKWSLMKSMIFHKQITLMNPEIDAIYIISPNVRLEMADRTNTGRHLFEFTQVDFEFKGKDRFFVQKFMEDLIDYVFDYINLNLEKELIRLRGEKLPKYSTFKSYSTEELEAIYGPDFEHEKSKESISPFWLSNHKREFYDKEDQQKPGTFHNYDLIWPEGFGEGLSGAEREFEYKQILKRMEETGTDQEIFKNYIQLAKDGLIPETAGAGFGVERMTRFICQLKDIDEATVFSRKPFTALHF